MNDLVEWFEYLIVGGLGLIAGVLIGGSVGAKAVKTTAVANGAARYTVNATNGEVQFEWIRPAKP